MLNWKKNTCPGTKSHTNHRHNGRHWCEVDVDMRMLSSSQFQSKTDRRPPTGCAENPFGRCSAALTGWSVGLSSTQRLESTPAMLYLRHTHTSTHTHTQSTTTRDCDRVSPPKSVRKTAVEKVCRWNRNIQHVRSARSQWRPTSKWIR